jgi:ribosome-binding factor A
MSDRLRRVDEAIRQVIGEALAGDIKDPRVGFVTVTDVRTSADLCHAHVYVSVLGDANARKSSVDGLQSAHGFLQRRIARELRLKRTPTLQFHYDATTDKAMALEQLLRKSSIAEAGTGPAGAGAGAAAEAGVRPGTGAAAETQRGPSGGAEA